MDALEAAQCWSTPSHLRSYERQNGDLGGEFGAVQPQSRGVDKRGLLA